MHDYFDRSWSFAFWQKFFDLMPWQVRTAALAIVFCQAKIDIRRSDWTTVSKDSRRNRVRKNLLRTLLDLCAQTTINRTSIIAG